jgi:hypothetical protein
LSGSNDASKDAMGLAASVRKNASFIAVMFAIAITGLALIVATVSLLVHR